MWLFDGIRDQDRALTILKRALEKERIPAAYMFCGLPGTGRMGAAQAMAASLNCEEGHIACGQCKSCRLQAAGNHPDLHIIGPEEGKREIVIKQVREDILEKAYLRPMQGAASVFIVDDAHLMNQSASNAFLKTLEEPPDTSRFILLVPSKDSVLPTIASRCQAVMFHPLPRSTVSELLRGQDVEPDRAELIAAMARGSMARAVAYHEADVPGTIATEFEPLSSIHESDAADLLDLSQRWSRNRDDALGVLEFMAQWYRDLMILAEGGPEEQVIHAAQMPLLQRAAERGGPAVAASLESVESARESLMANANVQLTMDNLLLDIRAVHST
jgi:DNA polymerase-3 subunit delta'